MSDLNIAVRLLEQGQREAAARALEKILGEDIDNITAWRLLAQAVSEPAEQLECYENVLRLDPRDPEAIEALRNAAEAMQAPEAAPPFFAEDLEELAPPVHPLEPPVFLPDEEEAPTAAQAMPTTEEAKAAEASLFDEEVEPPAASSRGLFDNDAIFYSLIVIVVVFVTVVVLALTNGNILTLLRSIFP